MVEHGMDSTRESNNHNERKGQSAMGGSTGTRKEAS